MGDIGNTDGNVYFDNNYYGDYPFTSDGGGLAVRTNGQWGAIISTENMPYLKAEFDSLAVGNPAYNPADGHLYVDHRVGAVHDNNSHYGYFAGYRSDGKRGFYLGYGDGGNVVDLRLDDATVLSLTGGELDMDVGAIRFRDPENSSTDVRMSGGSLDGYAPTGVLLRTEKNPPDGSPIFTVMSSGGSERLRVEHGGETYTSNSFRTASYIRAGDEVEAYYGSDRRKKSYVQPIHDPIETLRDVKGYEFQFNANNHAWKRGKWSYGLIAQEVEKHLPHAIRINQDGYLAIEGAQLHGFHVAVDRAQQAEIERLKRRVTALETKLESA